MARRLYDHAGLLYGRRVSGILTFIKANFWSIALSGLVPALLWVLIGGGFCLALFRHARRRRWLEGRLRTVLSAILTANLVLIVVPVTGLAGGGAACARKAASLLGEGGSGNDSLDTAIQERIGTLVLTPVIEVYTGDGTDYAALDAIEGRQGVDLAVLADKTVAQKTLGALSEGDLDAAMWRVRRGLGAPKTSLPARAVVLILERGHQAFVGSLDLFPDLLAAITPHDDGTLPAPEAARQVGARLMSAHGETLADRAIGRLHLGVAALAVAQFFVLLLLCTALAWASRAPE